MVVRTLRFLVLATALGACVDPAATPPDAGETPVPLSERCVMATRAPAPTDIDEDGIRLAQVPGAVLGWVQSLSCPARSERLEGLLEGADLDERYTLRFTPLAHATALSDLAVFAPACAEAASHGVLLDPLVARQSCPLARSFAAVGGSWADYAVLWDVRRLLHDLEIGPGADDADRAIDDAVRTLLVPSGFDPNLGRGIPDDTSALARLLDRWRARWPDARLAALAPRAELCELRRSEGYVLELDGAALLSSIETPRRADEAISDGYELSGYLQTLSDLAWTARDLERPRAWHDCDDACRAIWRALGEQLDADLARVCPAP